MKFILFVIALFLLVYWCTPNSEDQPLYQTTEDKLLGCFTGFDGSMYDLKAAVEKQLNDPDSFEHIETRGSVEDSSPKALMRFRAKNGFGGYVTSYATADVEVSDCSVSNVVINK